MCTTAGALIPDIVCRGFRDLLEADVSAVIGAQQYERCPEASHPLQRL
jgi:putative transposase